MFGVRQVGVLDDVINDDDDDDAISDDDDDDDDASIDRDCDGHDGSDGGVDDDDDDDDVQDAGFHKAVHAIKYQNMINNYKNCRYTKLKRELISALETEVSHRFPKNLEAVVLQSFQS